MESVELYLNAEDLYIEAVEQRLPFGADLKLITCDDGTASGAACAVSLPSPCRPQMARRIGSKPPRR